MLKVNEIIVVEGRYDKNTVSQAVDATIIETAGFGIFSDKEKLSLLRRFAEKRGLIIFTDSDSAGFLIRGHIKGLINNGKVGHAYIPDILGREKRKRTASKEGKLGVEGMSREVIISALIRAGATFSDQESDKSTTEPITKADMYEAGLSGTAGSSERRLQLLKHLELPAHLSPNGLLDVLNVLYSKNQFCDLISNLFGNI